MGRPINGNFLCVFVLQVGGGDGSAVQWAARHGRRPPPPDTTSHAVGTDRRIGANSPPGRLLRKVNERAIIQPAKLELSAAECRRRSANERAAAMTGQRRHRRRLSQHTHTDRQTRAVPHWEHTTAWSVVFRRTVSSLAVSIENVYSVGR